MTEQDIEERLKALEKQHKELCECFGSLSGGVQEILAIVDAGKEFFRIAGITATWLNRIARWFAPIVGAAIALAAAWHNWRHPN